MLMILPFWNFVLSIFQKIRIMSKNVVSKNKANYKLMLLHIKKKIIQKWLKSILQNVLFKWRGSLIKALQHSHFDSRSKKFADYYKSYPWKNT